MASSHFLYDSLMNVFILTETLQARSIVFLYHWGKGSPESSANLPQVLLWGRTVIPSWGHTWDLPPLQMVYLDQKSVMQRARISNFSIAVVKHHHQSNLQSLYLGLGVQRVRVLDGRMGI